jgi:hypothetical protein
MKIEIIEVKTKKDLRDFIKLPAKLHRKHKNWVPPIYSDDFLFFNPKKNRSFNHSDTILLLAKRDNKYVGRIMGIINHKYNELHNEEDARFCFLESHDDFEIVETLINHIEYWAKQKGMKKLVGPLGFSDKDPQGLLIEGFEEPNVIATNYNFEYMINLLKKAGFAKKRDLVVYKLLILDEIPTFYERINNRAIKINHGKKVIEFSSRRQIKPYIRPVLQLMNETYKDIYAFAPLDEKEMDEFASRYLLILDPKFIKVIINDLKEVIAFIISMPDISEGIKKCKGHLFPFGIFQILISQKRTKQLNLLLGAIREDQRNIGLDTIMGVKLFEEARNAGIEYIDSHLILESNLKSRAELERMGGEVYKRYRIYDKKI